MSSNNGGVQRTVLIVGAPQDLGEQMAAAFIPDGYTTRIVAEAVEEVLDASGNVRKEFLSKCGTIPCRILTLLEPADVSRLVHALFNLWVFDSS
jgi:NAD(P)-dependent dehydrogenase (short-subunit alcohol dehydrogenase family)